MNSNLKLSTSCCKNNPDTNIIMLGFFDSGHSAHFRCFGFNTVICTNRKKVAYKTRSTCCKIPIFFFEDSSQVNDFNRHCLVLSVLVLERLDFSSHAFKKPTHPIINIKMFYNVQLIWVYLHWVLYIK